MLRRRNAGGGLRPRPAPQPLAHLPADEVQRPAPLHGGPFPSGQGLVRPPGAEPVEQLTHGRKPSVPPRERLEPLLGERVHTPVRGEALDRKSTRLNSSHLVISY